MHHDRRMGLLYDHIDYHPNAWWYDDNITCLSCEWMNNMILSLLSYIRCNTCNSLIMHQYKITFGIVIMYDGRQYRDKVVLVNSMIDALPCNYGEMLSLQWYVIFATMWQGVTHVMRYYVLLCDAISRQRIIYLIPEYDLNTIVFRRTTYR